MFLVHLTLKHHFIFFLIRFLFGTLYDAGGKTSNMTEMYWGEKTEDGMLKRLHIALPLMYNGDSVSFTAKEVQKMAENRVYEGQGEWMGLGVCVVVVVIFNARYFRFYWWIKYNICVI